MINDAMFGKIEYEYFWSRNSKINFSNKEAGKATGRTNMAGKKH